VRTFAVAEMTSIKSDANTFLFGTIFYQMALFLFCYYLLPAFSQTFLGWNNTDLEVPGDVQLQHEFMHGHLIPLRMFCICCLFFLSEASTSSLCSFSIMLWFLKILIP
jgi:hypothetical protein